MAAPEVSPPATQSNSPQSAGTRTPLSISLSNIPPLSQPSPPSNTLIITNLLNETIFSQSSLRDIQALFIAHTTHGLHAFSPLRSFRRIILSFYTIEDAISLRTQLSSVPILGCTPKIYFGEPTPLEILDEERFLKAPKSQKMFFISPPPSPPMGWEMHEEGAPNEMVLAEDLASALEGLNSRTKSRAWANGGLEDDGSEGEDGKKRRSGTGTFVYHPEDHGGKEGLPAVMVEDTTGHEDEDEEDRPKILAHTARPPVELMDNA